MLYALFHIFEPFYSFDTLHCGAPEQYEALRSKEHTLRRFNPSGVAIPKLIELAVMLCFEVSPFLFSGSIGTLNAIKFYTILALLLLKGNKCKLLLGGNSMFGMLNSFVVIRWVKQDCESMKYLVDNLYTI